VGPKKSRVTESDTGTPCASVACGQAQFGKNRLWLAFQTREAAYNCRVARGWESKSVEEQQSQAASSSQHSNQPLSAAEITRKRERERLLLSRKHVLGQLSSAHNPRHREMLQAALAELDARLARLV